MEAVKGYAIEYFNATNHYTISTIIVVPYITWLERLNKGWDGRHAPNYRINFYMRQDENSGYILMHALVREKVNNAS